MHKFTKILTVLFISVLFIFESNAQVLNDSSFVMHSMALDILNKNSSTPKQAIEYIRTKNRTEADKIEALINKNNIDPNLSLPKFVYNKNAIEFTFDKQTFSFHILSNGDVKMEYNNRSITFNQPLDVDKIHDSIIKFLGGNDTHIQHSTTLLNLIFPNSYAFIGAGLVPLRWLIATIVVPLVVLAAADVHQHMFEKNIGEADTLCQLNISKNPSITEEKKIEELYSLLTTKCLGEDLKEEYWAKLCPKINSVKNCLATILQKNSKINESTKSKIEPSIIDKQPANGIRQK